MKKRIIILGSVVLAVVLVWTAGWLFVVGWVRHEVDLLALNDGQTAPRVVCGRLDLGGYPFNIDLVCSDASLVSGDVEVSIPRLRASAMVYRPNHVIALATGPIGFADAFTGQESSLAFTDLTASLRVEDWRIARVSLVGNGFVWTDTLFDQELGRADQIEAHLLDIPEAHDATAQVASLAGYLRGSNLAVPALAVTELNTEAELELSGLPDDVRNWGAEPLLPLWQRNGGALRVVSIRANGPTETLEASGEVSLDAAGAANGTMAITSTGVAERIGPMIEDPWRTMVLGVPDAEGKHVNQLTLRSGVLSSGLIPIASLPPLF